MKQKLARIQTILDKFTAMKDRPPDFRFVVLLLLMATGAVISYWIIITVTGRINSACLSY